MPELTHQDKIHLNARAKVHGLPVLWPEAEAAMEELFRGWQRSQVEAMRNMGLGGVGGGQRMGQAGRLQTPWHSDPLSAYLGDLTPMGTLRAPEHFFIDLPFLQKNPDPSPLSRLLDHLRHRVGLP